MSLNPDGSDVVERFGMRGPGGVNNLVMGTVVQAAGGCLCLENSLFESVIRYINLREGEVILLDTQPVLSISAGPMPGGSARLCL